MFSFLSLVYKCKAFPLSDNTVMLMSLFGFVTIFVCLSPIDRDDVFAPYPHPPFFSMCFKSVMLVFLLMVL